MTTRFLYDGTDMIAEYNASNAMQRRYVHGPGTDEPILWYEGSALTDRRWLHADERGSVTAISNSSGAAIAINTYDEYGIPAATNIGRFQYTGQAWLSEIGMYYYKARIYSPTLGRFMQTDPIRYNAGMNWYNYVGSDPVNKVDPSGLVDEPPGTIVNGYPAVPDGQVCSGYGCAGIFGGGGGYALPSPSPNGLNYGRLIIAAATSFDANQQDATKKKKAPLPGKKKEDDAQSCYTNYGVVQCNRQATKEEACKGAQGLVDFGSGDGAWAAGVLALSKAAGPFKWAGAAVAAASYGAGRGVQILSGCNK